MSEADSSFDVRGNHELVGQRLKKLKNTVRILLIFSTFGVLTMTAEKVKGHRRLGAQLMCLLGDGVTHGSAEQ